MDHDGRYRLEEIGAVETDGPSAAVERVVATYREVDELGRIATGWAPYSGKAIVEPLDALATYKLDWYADDHAVTVWDHDGRYHEDGAVDDV